ELIASYPGGDWIPISKTPEFYDRLLDALAAEAKGEKNVGRTASRDARTIVKKKEELEKAKPEKPEKSLTPTPVPPPAPSQNDELELVEIEERHRPEEEVAGAVRRWPTLTSRDSIIELIDLKA